MQTNGFHQPNWKNDFAPYFPKATIRRCGKDVRRVLNHFPSSVIEVLIQELKKRTVSGSFSHTDLLGTLARILSPSSSTEAILEQRKALYAKIDRNCTAQYKHDFEWWFAQISGKPSLGEHTSEHRCNFTEMTIHWCRELIANRFIKEVRVTENTEWGI